jgi:hypothetical protein
MGRPDPIEGRPSVSDDNPFSEALFRTSEVPTQLPEKPFQSLVEALQWVESFVRWYNEEHLHSGPSLRHARHTPRRQRMPGPGKPSRRVHGSQTPDAASQDVVHSQLVSRRCRVPQPHQAGGARRPDRVSSPVTIFRTTILITPATDSR